MLQHHAHTENVADAFRNYASISPELIWDWDLVNDMVWRNKSYDDFFGYSHSEEHHIGVWAGNVHPVDKERVELSIQKAIHDKAKVWTEEYRYYKRNKEIVFVLDRGFITYNENNVAQRMVGSKLDISKRYINPGDASGSDTKYRTIFDRASDSIVIYARDGTVLDVNVVASEISGYSFEEIKRKNIEDILQIGELVKTPIPFEALALGEISQTKRGIRTKIGAERTMDVSTRMLPDGSFMAVMRDITDKSEAENALRNSERRFRSLASNAPIGIFECDSEGNTIYVNDKLLEYTELSFDDHMGNDWLKAIYPEDRERVMLGWAKMLEDRKESYAEYRYLNKGGKVRWVSGRAVPVFDKEGSYKGYLGTVDDITEEREAKFDLQNNEEKYRMLIEQASDAIYIIDFSGQILTANRSASTMSLYSNEELMTMNIYQFLEPSEIEKTPLKFDDLRDGKTVSVERRLRNKDGNYLTFDTTAKMMSDGRLLVFARDITERIKARNEILKEKYLSDSIINSLPGIFYLHDNDGNFVRWNENFCKLMGYSDDEVNSMKVWDFFNEADQQFMRSKVREISENGQADGEIEFHTKLKQSIAFFFTGFEVTYDGRPCIIASCVDITEKRKSELMLMKSYEDIRLLASHLTHVREEERKRIGREIHDELGQKLTAIKMDVAWMQSKISEKDGDLFSATRNIVELLDASNLSVKRILSELRPAVIDNFGLLEAIKELNQQFTKTSKIPLDFITTESKINISQSSANCIFRVYQESLTNIMRHSKARNVTSSLKVCDGEIIVTVDDDGLGFEMLNVQSAKSFGILGMRERILSQNGHFAIKSEPEIGTQIEFSLPL